MHTQHVKFSTYVAWGSGVDVVVAVVLVFEEGEVAGLVEDDDDDRSVLEEVVVVVVFFFLPSPLFCFCFCFCFFFFFFLLLQGFIGTVPSNNLKILYDHQSGGRLPAGFGNF
jgi:hypothetical protein